ncbi:actin-related protein 2/3 complex subunit 5 [Obelidium mucronatum]|nr:actin-related protein 2/3 complex subunit 5 [Obelidium mucronatum]
MADFDDDDFEVETLLPAARGEYELNSAIQDRLNNVRALIARGGFAEALSKALEDPAVGRDPQGAKDKNLQVVMEALAAPRSTDIPVVVKQLPAYQLDVLMKFIYRGMGSPELYNPSVLLAWHEKVTEVTGLGSIVRVLTDRQTV